MTVKTETKEVWYCDSCNRRSESPLTKCPICNKENCYTCSHQLYDVWGANICQKCLEDENINAYFMSDWKHWLVIRKQIIESLVIKFGKEKHDKEKVA